MQVVLGLLAVVALVLGVLMVVQWRTGEQVLGGSRRPPEQIRRESGLAAIEYVAGALALVAMLADQLLLALVLLVVAGAAYVALMVGRRR